MPARGSGSPTSRRQTSQSWRQAYGHGLATSHPFIDGNKRIAFVTMAVFAGLNGKAIEAPESEVVSVMTALAGGELPEAALADWLRATASRSQRRVSQANA